ncbi:hypothetical protein AHF37_01817 [Paragonimus kellicotti]|nr:hypothetical protein AHF37_01817 [Paragonimus kellicotti]
MLVLESSVDGEVISPNTALELKLTLDLSLSYYNDTLNQWEQLLETLPDEGDRMWSIQLEMYTSNMEELIAEEDMDEVGCLQASTNSILLVSRDNLELTLSKSALDLLCNLGQSFEAAYRQQYSEAEYELGVHLAAPYRIQNKTGRAIALRVDPQALHVMDETSHFLVANVRKSFAHSIRLQRNSTVLGRIEPEKSNRRLSVITADATLEDLGQGTYLLASGQEVGLVESKRVSRPLTIRSMSDKSVHHTVWATWASLAQPTSGKRVETALPLRASGNLLLHLVHKLPKETVSQKECQSIPVVAEVITHLGMRVIQLRSTVQIVNDTSDTLCLYSRALRNSSDSSRPGRLATLDAGEIYAVPVDIINSLEVTGLFIGPDVGITTMSTTAAYWPEYACGRRSNAEPPTEYPNDLELTAEIGDQSYLVEDIYKVDSNCLKVTTGFRMHYTMQKELVIMDASIKGLLVVACPYNEPIGGKCSKEILSPTEVHFYSKQAINSSSQGSLHLDTLFININPGTIQLIAHIVSSVQSAAASSKSAEPAKKPVNVQAGSETRAKRVSLRNAEVDVNFWDPVSLDELDLPYLKDDNGL